MAQNDSRPGKADGGPERPFEEICPQCGKPLYQCACTDRWEDEGGAPYVPPEENR